MSKVPRPSPEHEPPNLWSLLLTAITTPWAAPRLALLIFLPLAALVAVVSVVAIYPGSIGVGAVLGTTGVGASGYGIQRVIEHRRQARRSAAGAVTK